MKINRSILSFLFIASLISCKSNSETRVAEKQTLELAKVKTTVEKETAKNSFVVSCGTGCALTYSELNVSKEKDFIESEFEVEMFVNEVQAEKHLETYVFSLNESGEIVHVSFKDELTTSDDEELSHDLLKNLKQYATQFGTLNLDGTFGDDQSGSIEGSWKPVFESCEDMPLPCQYSYELIMDLEHFVLLDHPAAASLDHLENVQFCKVSDGNKKMLFAHGYLDSGQSELHLLSLNDAFEEAGEILLYTSQETEEGSILTRFEVDQDFLVKVIREERTNKKAKLIKETLFKIGDDGGFHELR